MWNNSPDAVTKCEASSSGGFDCNICLDSVQDAVVTLCGHLYCWPCIYKWLHFQTMSTENEDQKQQQCPVCKAGVSDSTLFPLYGRAGGVSTKSSRNKTPQFGVVIPKRPCGGSTIYPNATSNQHFAEQSHQRGYSYQPQMSNPQQVTYAASPVASGMTIHVLDPVTRMLGEMVCARVFRNSITHPNSYNLAWGTSPRIRRHVMQADESLSRISFFLFCCVLLCLLLF